MYFPLRIAFRYLISKKKATFISLISWLAMAGIAFGTAALIIVLSVFNGLEDLNRSLFKTFDADLSILPITGKKFDSNLVDIEMLKKLPFIKSTGNVIQENALVKYGDQQSVATIKGVEKSFLENEDFNKSIVEGEFKLMQDSGFQAVVGIGIQQNLSLSTENYFTPLEFWYPNKAANLALVTPNTFNKVLALPSSVFSIEQSYDNFIIAPIELTKQLFDRNNELSFIEINLKKEADLIESKEKIMPLLGKNLKILTRDEQHVGLLKAIKFEKLFVFLALLFIVGIAALNIFFSLSMLVMEKTEDIKTMKAIGANNQIIRNIFKIEGALISFLGAAVGIIIGFTICVLQLKYGFLKMGMVSALVDAYPVRLELTDFLATATGIILITIIISQFPAKKASSF